MDELFFKRIQGVAVVFLQRLTLGVGFRQQFVQGSNVLVEKAAALGLRIQFKLIETFLEAF